MIFYLCFQLPNGKGAWDDGQAKKAPRRRGGRNKVGNLLGLLNESHPRVFQGTTLPLFTAF